MLSRFCFFMPILFPSSEALGILDGVSAHPQWILPHRLPSGGLVDGWPDRCPVPLGWSTEGSPCLANHQGAYSIFFCLKTDVSRFLAFVTGRVCWLWSIDIPGIHSGPSVVPQYHHLPMVISMLIICQQLPGWSRVWFGRRLPAQRNILGIGSTFCEMRCQLREMPLSGLPVKGQGPTGKLVCKAELRFLRDISESFWIYSFPGLIIQLKKLGGSLLLVFQEVEAFPGPIFVRRQGGFALPKSGLHLQGRRMCRGVWSKWKEMLLGWAIWAMFRNPGWLVMSSEDCTNQYIYMYIYIYIWIFILILGIVIIHELGIPIGSISLAKSKSSHGSWIP